MALHFNPTKTQKQRKLRFEEKLSENTSHVKIMYYDWSSTSREAKKEQTIHP